MTAIWVEITGTRGSTPRDVGTAMKVTAGGTEGTIGGGALEFRAIAEARTLLENGGGENTRSYPLGPDLGQCCGGAVTLLFTRDARAVDPAPAPLRGAGGFATGDALWLWGAGHVGRAVVHALPPKAFDVTWVDSEPERFPANIPAHVTAVPAANMPRLAPRAPGGAHHLIFTYSHEIDLALCAALLGRGAKSIGLIGSATKWARFRSRLRALSLSDAQIDRIQCPIGDPSLGKSPEAIAKGVVAGLLRPQTEGMLTGAAT